MLISVLAFTKTGTPSPTFLGADKLLDHEDKYFSLATSSTGNRAGELQAQPNSPSAISWQVTPQAHDKNRVCVSDPALLDPTEVGT